MAFADQLGDRDNVQLCVSGEGARMNVDDLLGAHLGPGVHIYSCGPQRLLDAVTARCAELGMSKQLHVEHFSGTAVELDPDAEVAFEVELTRSAKTLTVAPDQTILDAVLACGIKRRTVAPKASAVPARPRSSRAKSTIAIRSSTRTSRPRTT